MVFLTVLWHIINFITRNTSCFVLHASENFPCVITVVPSCVVCSLNLNCSVAQNVSILYPHKELYSNITLLHVRAVTQSQSAKAFIGFCVKLYAPLVDDNRSIQSVWRADYFCIFHLKIPIVTFTHPHVPPNDFLCFEVLTLTA